MKFVIDWLGTAKFSYNNKVHLATKVSSFEANYGQDPRMEFEGRRRRRHKAAEEFVERIKRIQKEAKVALKKA